MAGRFSLPAPPHLQLPVGGGGGGSRPRGAAGSLSQAWLWLSTPANGGVGMSGWMQVSRGGAFCSWHLQPGLALLAWSPRGPVGGRVDYARFVLTCRLALRPLPKLARVL